MVTYNSNNSNNYLITPDKNNFNFPKREESLHLRKIINNKNK